MIPVDRPLIDANYIMAFLSGHFKKSIQNLEEVFSSYIGLENTLFTNSCRSALYLTYKSLKLKGKVITQPLTCSVAILPMICCGLKPHFVDIDPYTYNINPETINESITNNTCAIQIIHLAGNPCNIRAVKEIAEDNHLILIEDCAQALGAEYQGEKVGSFGDVSCFSFTKNIYGISGGVLSTNDKGIFLGAQKIQKNFHRFPTSIAYYRLMRNIIEKERNTLLGDIAYKILFNLRSKAIPDGIKNCSFLQSNLYNPIKMESSVVLLQLKEIDNLLDKRIQNALLLNKALQNNERIKFQQTLRDSKHIYTKYMIETQCNSIDLIKELHKNRIDAKHLEYKHAMTCQTRFDIDPFYERFKSIQKCKNYLNIHDHIVSLPISSNMTESEVQFIANQVFIAIEKLNG